MDGSRLRITADKREIKDFPKLPSATSFIHKPLYKIGADLMLNISRYAINCPF